MERFAAIEGYLRAERTRLFWDRFAPDLRAHGFVRRAAFKPEDVPKLLGNIVLLERTEADFRYRLVGSNIAGLHGRDLTGQTLAEWPAPTAAVIRAQYDTVLATGAPVLSHYFGPAYSGGRFQLVERRWEKLALPLAFGSGPDGVLVFASELAKADAWPACVKGTPASGCWCAVPGQPQAAATI